MTMEHLMIALGGLVLALVLFRAAFLTGRKLDNYGFVDVVWAFSFPLLAGFHAWTADGDPVRTGLLVLFVCLWSGRLAVHLTRRFIQEHPGEDPRYHQLREKWGPRFSRNMYGLHLLQGAIAWILSLPFLLIVANPSPGIGIWETAGLALGVIALVGEAIADAQLRRFKNHPSNRGLVCRTGLWGYSRHPNYFFQWLGWMAVAVFACGSPCGWVSIIAPLIMYYLLVEVTGVPPAEAHALQSRGDAYRRYQQTTNAFFPGPRGLPSGE